MHISDDHLVGNLVQQMDFTVLWPWQMELRAKAGRHKSPTYVLLHK